MLPIELKVVQSAIMAALVKEFGVGADLDDSSMVHSHYLVRL